jgi:hypothetical protein
MTNNTTRNWKTTIMGILVLLNLAFGVYKNPAMLNDTSGQTQIAGQVAVGIGLLAAKDSDKSGTVQVPRN